MTYRDHPDNQPDDYQPDHRLEYTAGDTGETFTGQPHGYTGSDKDTLLLAGCSCGAKDGRWFRAGAKARIQGGNFLRRHLRMEAQ